MELNITRKIDDGWRWRFAIVPVRINDDKMIWLEIYYERKTELRDDKYRIVRKYKSGIWQHPTIWCDDSYA